MSCGVTEDLILSHHMDNLFNRENIKFNYAYGAYYPEVKCKCSIVVEASNDVLLRGLPMHSTDMALRACPLPIVSPHYPNSV